MSGRLDVGWLVALLVVDLLLGTAVLVMIYAPRPMGRWLAVIMWIWIPALCGALFLLVTTMP